MSSWPATVIIVVKPSKLVELPPAARRAWANRNVLTASETSSNTQPLGDSFLACTTWPPPSWRKFSFQTK